jgi:hypothetical protein
MTMAVEMAEITKIPVKKPMATSSAPRARRLRSRRAMLTLLGAGVLGTALTGTSRREANAYPKHP